MSPFYVPCNLDLGLDVGRKLTKSLIEMNTLSNVTQDYYTLAHRLEKINGKNSY